jgi:hypothetical protein
MSASARNVAATTIQRILVHELDPISLGPIRRRFALSRHSVVIVYDAHTLFRYITTSGDTRDPIARQELVAHERMRLERLARAPLPSIVELRKLHDDVVSARYLVDFVEQHGREIRGHELELDRYRALLFPPYPPSPPNDDDDDAAVEWRFVRFSLSNYFHAPVVTTTIPNIEELSMGISIHRAISLPNATFTSSMSTPPPVTRSSGINLTSPRTLRSHRSSSPAYTLWERRRLIWLQEHTMTAVVRR